MLRAPWLTIASTMLVAACGGNDPVAKGANNTAGLPEVNLPAPSATGAPPVNAVEPASTSDPVEAAKPIPAALQGRWGLAPLDCTSTKGDAKGLLVIDSERLRFYESVAVPSKDVTTTPDSMRGNFDYTGEGQSWTKFQALQLQGRNLIRTESNPSASFTYAKCE